MVFPFLPLLRRMRHGVTLGVRVLAADAQGRVLLVKHGYTPGWHLPGGGVDAGESASAAAHRELLEEANARVDGALELHGLFFHPAYGGRDHVVCYRGRVGRDHVVCYRGRVRQEAPLRPNMEILAASFFPLDALPDGLTPATGRRIAEWRDGRTPPADW